MELVLATHNRGKQQELRRLLGTFGLQLRSAAELGLALPPESGASYRDNAAIKAEAAARSLHCFALGDDAGLAVPSLGGEPGVYTARYTDRMGGAAAACADLAARTGLLAGAEQVRASLDCALVLAHPDGTIHCGEASIAGRLCWPPHGAPGLAAIFTPDPPLELTTDGVLVHRRVAFDRLAEALRSVFR